MIPLIGFAPDADPVTPGVLTDCTNLVPFEAGFKGAPSPVSIGVAPLGAECRGAAAISDLSGNRRLIAGTATQLLELTGSTWTDVSGSTYALGSDDRWSFIQFANSTLAANPAGKIQRSVSGAFADIASAPSAKLIEASQGFAVAFNTSTNADGWHCSAYLDDTDWNLSLSTQCVSGRLVGGSGPITAARRFGEDLIAYKNGTLFVGRYVGAPSVWQWTQASNDVGCVGPDAVVDTAIGHVFVGRDNVYLWDGTTPRPLATGVIRNWLFRDMSTLYRYKVICLWDRPNHLVWIYYPSVQSNGEVDSCVVYHILKQQWGLAHTSIEAAVTYTSPSITYAGTPIVTTFDASPTISFDSPFWVSSTQNPSVFTESHVLSTLTGPCSSSSFTTGDMGDDEGYSTCTNFRVRYSVNPETSVATGYVKNEEGLVFDTGSTSASADGRHNMRQTARWHRFKVETTGDFQLTAIRPELKPAGTR
jgi:hypothetical protein